jgi:hypothetical protein
MCWPPRRQPSDPEPRSIWRTSRFAINDFDRDGRIENAVFHSVREIIIVSTMTPLVFKTRNQKKSSKTA